MINTNFVTAWVVAAFVVYEVAVFVFGADVSALPALLAGYGWFSCLNSRDRVTIAGRGGSPR